MKVEFFALYRLPIHTTSLTNLAAFLSTLGLNLAPKWSGAAYHYEGVERIVEHRAHSSWCSLEELERRLMSGDFGYQTAVVAPCIATAPFNLGFIELQGVLHGVLELSHQSLTLFHEARLARGGGSEELIFGLHRALGSTGMTLGWESTVDTLAALLAGTIATSRLEDLLNGSEIRALLGGAQEIEAAMLRTELYRPVGYSDLTPLVSWFPDFPR